MFNRISFIIKTFFLNPVIFFKKAIGRILMTVIPSPKGVVHSKIGAYTIDTLPHRNIWWKSMWLGCCSVEIAHNIRKILSPGGVFIDVGAGIGYFSAIASEIVGGSGEVHCFEPYPLNAEAIRRMINGTPNSNIFFNDYALGVDDSVHDFYMTKSFNSTQCSMVDCFVKKEPDRILKIRTQRLDNYLEQKNTNEISLIKVDVEGYEYFVLKGLSRFFERITKRPPIICEIFPPVYRRLGISLYEFHAYMKEYGYQAYNILNPRKKVDIRLLKEITDVIFFHVI